MVSLHFDLWHREIRATGISLRNQRADAPWEKGEIGQAAVHFRLKKLFAPTLPVNIEVSSWSVVLSSHAAANPGMTTGAEPESASSTPTESRIRVMRLSAREGDVEIHLSDDRKILVHEAAFEAGDNGAGVWTTHLKAGSITAESLAAEASSVELRGDRKKIAFSQLRMRCNSGMITGEGEVSLNGNHETRMTLKAIDIPVAMLVGLQWQMKLSGLTSGGSRL